MAFKKWCRCHTCGEMGEPGKHLCPPKIARDDWVDVKGSVTRLVAFHCPQCEAQCATNSVEPDKQPANSYGTAWYTCDGCGVHQKVLFDRWPMKPQRPPARRKYYRGDTYGT